MAFSRLRGNYTGMHQKLPGMRQNKLRETKRSLVYTIPKDAVHELGLEDGEVPDEVAIDTEKRELMLSF